MQEKRKPVEKRDADGGPVCFTRGESLLSGGGSGAAAGGPLTPTHCCSSAESSSVETPLDRCQGLTRREEILPRAELCSAVAAVRLSANGPLFQMAQYFLLLLLFFLWRLLYTTSTVNPNVNIKKIAFQHLFFKNVYL